MKLLKNKLFIVLVIAVAFTAWYEIFSIPNNKMQQAQLLTWLQTSNTTQFCGVIFPRLANCVTFQRSDCEKITQPPLAVCINNIKPGLASEVTIPESKTLYTNVAACFEKELHQIILQSYVVDSPECKQKMS